MDLYEFKDGKYEAPKTKTWLCIESNSRLRNQLYISPILSDACFL